MPKRARKDLDKVQDRRAEVVRLRAEGRTFDQIAQLTGYCNGSAAGKAWKAAIKQRPDQTVDEVRRQEKTRLEQMDSDLAAIIDRPPVKTTSIGRTQWDVRTCTCDVKAATNREHDPDCKVVPVLDVGQVTAAVRTRLALGESLRKLVGADAASGAPLVDARTQVMVTQWNDIRQFRADHAGHPALAAPVVVDGLTVPGVAVRGDAASRAWAAEEVRRTREATRNADIVEAEIIEEDP